MTDIYQNKGKKNVYICECCGHGFVSEDLDDGVTPFMTNCDLCGGTATSLCYRIPQGWLRAVKAAFVWRKPTDTEYAALCDHHKNHVDNGGLLKFPNNPAARTGSYNDD